MSSARKNGFKPVRRTGGYLPLEDHGVVGDGITAALVGRDGGVSWLCVPRFDSPALFCGILDHARGGAFTVAPDDLVESRQRYEHDTGVLVTEMRSRDGGVVRVTDALTLVPDADLGALGRHGRGELLRTIDVTGGPARVRVEVSPRPDASAERHGDGLSLRVAGHEDVDLRLFCTRPLDGLRSVLELEPGDRVHVALRWGKRAGGDDPDDVLRSTIDSWRRWIQGCFHYDGPDADIVRRSAITLKLCDYTPTGALVAAPTSSLPEEIGGVRNWDYRYTWIRDAAFSVYALRRIGMEREASEFLTWALDAHWERGERPRVLYDLDGEEPDPERVDDGLEGYRGSRPVRWGNAAFEQRQNDVYGEILDCAYQWAAGGREIPEETWGDLCRLVEAAQDQWNEPDHGIWEVRTSGHVYTYSAALCQVALDRGAQIVERWGLTGDADGWRASSEKIRDAILAEAWDEERQTLTEYLGGGHLDASLLALPLRRVIHPQDPKMVATCRAVVAELGAGNGLLYRYKPEKSPDGLEGGEGAFLLCSFWLVDNLAYQGRLDEAFELFHSLCARANPVGLLSEQIDPSDGSFLGNFPQAFSHIGLISSGYNLSRLAETVTQAP